MLVCQNLSHHKRTAFFLTKQPICQRRFCVFLMALLCCNYQWQHWCMVKEGGKVKDFISDTPSFYTLFDLYLVKMSKLPHNIKTNNYTITEFERSKFFQCIQISLVKESYWWWKQWRKRVEFGCSLVASDPSKRWPESVLGTVCWAVETEVPSLLHPIRQNNRTL